MCTGLLPCADWSSILHTNTKSYSGDTEISLCETRIDFCITQFYFSPVNNAIKVLGPLHPPENAHKKKGLGFKSVERESPHTSCGMPLPRPASSRYLKKEPWGATINGPPPHPPPELLVNPLNLSQAPPSVYNPTRELISPPGSYLHVLHLFLLLYTSPCTAIICLSFLLSNYSFLPRDMFNSSLIRDPGPT